MKPNFLGRLLMTGALVAAGIAGAATRPNVFEPRTDAEIVKSLRHEVLMYPSYTIWDDVSFRVNNGQVELFGAVSQPFKKTDLQRLAQRLPGVTSVTNHVKVLPLSFHDDRLRRQVARAIYGHPSFARYGIQPIPPIHIIVENGHVTLTGVVNNEMEKQIAGMRASSAGLSFGAVTNRLQVENPSPKRG